MNAAAERHIAKAEGYLAKGEEFYLKAAAEIVAAKKADTTLSNREIGKRFGRSEPWVRKIVAWATTSSDRRGPAPYADDSADRPVRAARQVLREAPLEQIEQIISELPANRRQAILASAGSDYHRERERQDEKERFLSDRERKEREATGAAIDTHTQKLMGGFTSLSISGHIDQATEELHELVSSHALTKETWQPIDLSIDALLEEAAVAAAMVGLEAPERR